MDCIWENWGQWQPCSVPCGDGKKTRFRSVATEAQFEGTVCSGDFSEEKDCTNDNCLGT